MRVKALGRSVKRKTPAIKRDYSFSYKRRFRTHIHTYIYVYIYTQYKVDVCLRFDGRMGKVSAVTASDEQSPLPSSFIKKDKSSFAPVNDISFELFPLPLLHAHVRACVKSRQRRCNVSNVGVHVL